MKIIPEKDGLAVKQLFKTVKVPYKDIRSIVITKEQKTVVRTYGKEEYESNGLFGVVDCIPDAMEILVQNKILFRNEFELQEASDDVMEKALAQKRFDEVIESVREEADGMIKKRLGDRFELDMLVKDVELETDLYMRVRRDGKPFRDIPHPMINYQNDSITDAFDLTVLGWLCEWDPAENTSKYMLAEEMESVEVGKKYILEQVKIFCDDMLESNSREYLDQLP